MNENSVIISFQKIDMIFGSRTILNNLNMDIFKDEIIALVGKSGSGKSTLIKILLGFYPPTQGNIYYSGKNIVNNQKIISKIVGFVSQENSFYEKLTVYENLVFFAKLYQVNKRDIETRAEHLLELTKLSYAKDYYVSKISGGMKRKLEFAISLMHNPSILILDEPFTGLDVQIRDELWNVLVKIKKLGVTVIILTHLLSSAQKHVDRVFILSNYNIAKIVTKNELEADNFNLEKLFLEVTK